MRVMVWWLVGRWWWWWCERGGRASQHETRRAFLGSMAAERCTCDGGERQAHEGGGSCLGLYFFFFFFEFAPRIRFSLHHPHQVGVRGREGQYILSRARGRISLGCFNNIYVSPSTISWCPTARSLWDFFYFSTLSFPWKVSSRIFMKPRTSSSVTRSRASLCLRMNGMSTSISTFLISPVSISPLP